MSGAFDFKDDGRRPRALVTWLLWWDAFVTAWIGFAPGALFCLV